MKTLKISLLATLITVALMALCGIATATAETSDCGEFYPRLAVVTAYECIDENDTWIITCTDKEGNEWSFYGEQEDAQIGNIFNLLMWHLDDEEEMDEIVEVYFEGCMNYNALQDWLMGAWQ